MARGTSRNKGASNPKAKLKEGDVQSILVSLDASVDLGRRYGVDASTIRRIRRRCAWTHVTVSP